jgi:tyrosine-protein phosphatase SIW14
MHAQKWIPPRQKTLPVPMNAAVQRLIGRNSPRLWRFPTRDHAWVTVNRVGQLLVLVAIGVLATPCLGQESKPPPDAPVRSSQPGRPPGQAGARRQAPRSPLLDALDADHNGIIDAAEIANASAALETLDKNDDGQLTEDEYLPAPRPMAPGRRPGPPGRFGSRPAPTPAPQGGLANFSVVDDHLFRGAQPSAAGIEALKALGVTTIVDLIPPERIWEPEKAEAERNGIQYINVPMEPTGRPAPEQVNAILSVITNAPGKVFVHCQAGRDRTGTVVACYRILQCQWTTEQALREADEFRMSRLADQMKEFVADFAKARAP